jgi:hypothetical protein
LRPNHLQKANFCSSATGGGERRQWAAVDPYSGVNGGSRGSGKGQSRRTGNPRTDSFPFEPENWAGVDPNARPHP